MIKINKNDSIIDIVTKINNSLETEIILDFPFGHPILHNYTSLKILKNKTTSKNLRIITSDKTAQNILKRLKIKYSQIWDTDLLEYNYSSLEYSKYLFKRYLFEFTSLFSKNKDNIVFDYKKKYLVKNSKIWIFLLWLILSFLLLIFIFYFAVNKTYIYITPDITIKTRSENFIFREVQKDEILSKNIVWLEKIETTANLSEKFWTSWIDENNLKRAKWKVTFYNELEEEIKLLENTRLQTEDWIVYRSDTMINIPKATKSSSWEIVPGKTEIKITSQTHDNKWNIVWEKANIESDIKLTIPWLKTNKDKIYAITKWKITWANNKYTKILKNEDIVNAKNIFETKLKQQALNELKQIIIENNKLNNISYNILWVNDIIEYDNLEIKEEDWLKIWDKIDNFEVNWQIKITSYIYNTNKVLNQMSLGIKSRILENIEEFKFINEKSLRVANVISKKVNPLEIKATAEVEVFFTHNFLNKQNNYINNLKNSISWKDKDNALKILLNNPNISNVEISIRPFFISKVSKIHENIIIKVVE